MRSYAHEKFTSLNLSSHIWHTSILLANALKNSNWPSARFTVNCQKSFPYFMCISLLWTLSVNVHYDAMPCHVCGIAGVTKKLHKTEPTHLLQVNIIMIFTPISPTLKPLTRDVNNIDYLGIMAHVKGWDILCSKWTISSWSWCVGIRKNMQA